MEAYKKNNRRTNKGTWLICASNHRCCHPLIRVSVGLKAFPPNFPFLSRHSVIQKSYPSLFLHPSHLVTLEILITIKTEDVGIDNLQTNLL